MEHSRNKPPSSFDPLFSPAAAAAGEPWPFDMAVTGLVEITDGPIEFTPVPRLRRRRDGWSEEAQRAFIQALARCGCVARSARSVGMTPRSAYRLLDAKGADSFADAWDQAIARGVETLRLNALDRALNGAWVPIKRRGKIVRNELRINDRLAIALLSGRDHSVADRRERASSRRKYRLKLLERKRREAEERRRREEVWAQHQAVLDAIAAERDNPPPRIERASPRIRRL